VASIPIGDDGSLGSPNIIQHEGRSVHPTRQEKPHVHSVTVSPDNRFVIVADLGLDRIYSYALDAAAAKLMPAAQPFVTLTPGDGPRHFKFGRNGTQGYVINELGNTVTAFDYDLELGRLTPRQTLTTLPDDFNGESTGAEVRVHPNGTFLYASNRGHDSIAVFSIATGDGKLALIEIVKSGGRNPRNFALSPDGKWLVCAHQDTPLLTVFGVDLTTGRLTRAPQSAELSSCVCVEFLR
jgi:6-phosphogluconolactonase